MLNREGGYLVSEQVLKVFVVDDDPTARMLNMLQMQGVDVDIREFADGDACLAAVGDAPDIILLDVEMPGTDGVAVCRRLRAAGLTNAEIVFVSAHDDLETRLAAHDAGGNDYVVKPYAKADLVARIEVAKRTIRARREVAEHVQLARQRGTADMPAPSDMGVLMAFLWDAAFCQTVDDLGLAFCNALKQYGLHGLVDLHDARDSHCYSSQGRLTALEASILDHVRGMERVFQFHDRLAIQYPHTTLLIPNLPPVDHERASRLHDHLMVLVGSAEARFSAMLGEARCRAPAQSVTDAIAELARTLKETAAGTHGNPPADRLRKAAAEVVSQFGNRQYAGE